MRYPMLLSAALAPAPFAAALAEPPRIVQAFPDLGDESIPPSLTEILVDFDQDMSTRGWSVCGGGPDFPATGKPVWRTARQLAIPVTLEPGRRYSLSINCPAALGCRSASGEPAIPHPIRFTTLKDGEQAPPPLTPAQNRAAITRLREVIDQFYSHRDLRVSDWEGAFVAHTPAMEGATTPARFARASPPRRRSRSRSWRCHCADAGEPDRRSAFDCKSAKKTTRPR